MKQPTCPNEFGIYSSMVTLSFPPHMLKENGGHYTSKDSCDVDPCMVDEIKELWAHGIVTTGCCCGHGLKRGMINVLGKDAQRMLAFGYQLEDAVFDGACATTFVAKSVHESK